jgi:hypothetical protein
VVEAKRNKAKAGNSQIEERKYANGNRKQ